jgi:hypothetical protein
MIVHMGSKRPTAHSARHGQAQLGRPLAPQTARSWPRCGQCARHGELVGASLAVKTRKQTGHIHLRTTGSLPLHPTQEERVSKGVLTDEVRGAAEISGGEREKRLSWRWKHFGSVLQLHKREGNMRRWLGHLASDERWRN